MDFASQCISQQLSRKTGNGETNVFLPPDRILLGRESHKKPLLLSFCDTQTPISSTNANDALNSSESQSTVF